MVALKNHVVAVVKVIFEFPPASPHPPDIAEASYAVVNDISCKSTLLHVCVAPVFVIVRVVLMMFVLIKSRDVVALTPVRVRLFV